LINANYAAHIARLINDYNEALRFTNKEAPEINAILVHSGCEKYYYGDDQGVPFQAYGHLLRWVPVNRPNQFVYFQIDEKPIYFQIIPSDFWHEQGIDTDECWAENFSIVRLTSLDELAQYLQRPSKTNIAYLGEENELAASLGVSKALINPSKLLAYLDFSRAIKTEYELDQLRAANQLALKGHEAAKTCFLQGGTEYDIHMAFLHATRHLEEESPYTNIVALNEKAATLHYQFKRKVNNEKNRVLLIDAGCRVQAYCSDITRTSATDDAHPIFQSLLTAMEALELELVTEVKPGLPYQAIHTSALTKLAQVLIDHEICTGSVENLIDKELPQLFMPHGVGHLLGIQVHDVGGHQSNQNGSLLPPPASSPALRNTRMMEKDMVFTIEPGLYFIPLLLEAERASGKGKFINWKLIEALYSSGGIRVEDNVRVTTDSAENLTRQFE
jgi:Xaa-Pro dipeptidase